MKEEIEIPIERLPVYQKNFLAMVDSHESIKLTLRLLFENTGFDPEERVQLERIVEAHVTFFAKLKEARIVIRGAKPEHTTELKEMLSVDGWLDEETLQGELKELAVALNMSSAAIHFKRMIKPYKDGLMAKEWDLMHLF